MIDNVKCKYPAEYYKV